ncbi:MAG: cellulose biosynthesis cyclic di-GMP-binding regulatory protein BcsB [Desulfamplus sp.]|nr:cellulose biosynthesis cyclic di-GMP-binding regulatory protein BcsB [Desulfamplus sp.]
MINFTMRLKPRIIILINLLFFASVLFSLPQVSFAQTIRMPLKDILQVENIRLEGIKDNTDKYEFKLSIPERWQVKQALLTFSYSNSSSLIKNRSQLVFYMDNTPLAQTALDPLSPQGVMTVPIPGRLLTSGYHPFSFSVSQHSVENNCEDPTAPELWTLVELSEATVDFDFTLKPVPARISAVSDFLFDPKNPSAPPVNLIFQDFDYMKPVTLCASGIALRYDYRMVNFTSSGNIESGMDNLLIGSEAFVKSALAGYDLPKENQDIKGPSLMVLNFKEDTYHSLIVVTGRTPDEVLIAAKAFSLLSLPLPDSSSALVKDIQIPQINPYTLKNGLEQGKVYTLSSLGFKTHTFKGITPIPKGFGFRLPSDAHLSPNSKATLLLNMAYGASMKEDSVLNIILNDQFVAAIPCKEINGGTYRNYKVELLLSSMNAGYNKLTISPQLNPMATDQCTMVQTGNLRLTLFEDSTFTLPVVDNWIEMPQLKAFMSDAFPFGKQPDMSETLIFLPDGKKSSFVAALNLVAIASQKTGFPPLGLEWYRTISDGGSVGNSNTGKTETNTSGKVESIMADKDIIVVSETSSIPENFSSAAPLNFSSSDSKGLTTGTGTVAYPHLVRAKGYDASEGEGFWSKILPHKGSHVSDISLVDSKIVVTRFEPVITREKAALIQFQSPFNRKRTVMMLAAGNEADMIKAGSVIWKPGVQAACSGDTSLINLTERADKNFDTISLRIGSSYYLGGVTPLPFMEYYANTYPLWFIACVVAICFIFSLALYQLIKIRRKRRLSNAQ